MQRSRGAPRRKNTQVEVFQWRRHGVQKRHAGSLEEFAGRLAALEGSGVAPFPTPCSSNPAMLGIPAASRMSSSPALHEARTLLEAGAGISRTRVPVKPTRGVPPRSVVPPASLSTLPKSSGHAQKLALTRGRVRSGARVWQLQKRSSPKLSTAADQEEEGSSDWAAMPTCSRESWSWQQPPLHHCGHFRTLRQVVVMVAGPLEKGRIGGFERQRAMLCQICGILEYAANDKSHDVARGSDCLAPTLDQTSSGRPPKYQLVSPGTGKQPHKSQQRNS